MLDIKFDLGQKIYNVKESIEKRYGTKPDSCELVLQDNNGNNIATMDNDKFLGFYSPQNGYWIYIVDQNPNSVLKGMEDLSSVEKYKISEEDYNNLPDSFRKFKQKIISSQQSGEQPQLPPVWDENYQKDISDQMQVGNRCKMLETGYIGEIKYIGKVPNKGQGYFVGVKLDLPFGNSDGKHISVQYFTCLDKYGIILRPDKIEVGDFPEEEDEI